MVLNILGLIIWTVCSIIYFTDPMGHDLSNWIVGIIGLNFVFYNLSRILEKCAKAK